jgi:tubulin delta
VHYLDLICVLCALGNQKKAAIMLSARAYVHQYEKFGLGVQDFSTCFGHIEDIVERYSML